MSTMQHTTQEHLRLRETYARGAPWRKWGP